MDANCSVDQVQPVVGESQLDQLLRRRIPSALPDPSSEPDIDRDPFAGALVHVLRMTVEPQDKQNTSETRAKALE